MSYWRTFSEVYNSPKQLYKLIAKERKETSEIIRWGEGLEKEVQLLKKEKDKEVKSLKEIIEEQKKQIAYQLGHLARYAPWGLEKKTPQQYEDQYWEAVRWGNKQNEDRRLRDQVRYEEMITKLPETVDNKTKEEISDYLLDHYYRVIPNRKEIKDNSFAAHVLRAVKLLREPMMTKKKDTKKDTDKEMKDALDILDTLTSDKPETNNVVPILRVITGGSDGPSSNWLIQLPPGTIFMCKKRGDDEFIAQQFTVDWRGKRGVLLSANIPTRMEIGVDSKGFSLTHECVEIQRKGIEDGTD